MIKYVYIEVHWCLISEFTWIHVIVERLLLPVQSIRLSCELDHSVGLITACKTNPNPYYSL